MEFGKRWQQDEEVRYEAVFSVTEQLIEVVEPRKIDLLAQDTPGFRIGSY